MRFEWDARKAAANFRKHGVQFFDACLIFSDPGVLSVYDGKHSEGEDRWVSIGSASGKLLLVVVHTHCQTETGEVVRIISARKPTPRERSAYRRHEP